MWGMNEVISSFEAEHVIKGLEAIPLEDIGCSKWKDQRANVERLANQCSINAQSGNSECYISNHVVSVDRMNVIVHELLAMEVWKAKVYPFIKKNLHNAAYMYLFYEQALANLLTFTTYNDAVVTEMGDELLELLDWCNRKISWLNGRPDEDKFIKPIDVKEEIKLSDDEMMQRQETETEFKISMTAVTIAWNIIKELTSLPMTVYNNLLIKNDFPMVFVALKVREPWIRRGKKGLIKKFMPGGEWKQVERNDAHMLNEFEGQVWTVLLMLLCDPECRKKYKYDSYRKEEICKLRRYLNDTLVDQLPQLSQIARAIEELSLNIEPPHHSEEAFRQSLTIEPVPEIMHELTYKKDWKAIASAQEAKLCGPQAAKDDVERMMKMLDAMGLGE